jgi:hypothetical protein
MPEATIDENGVIECGVWSFNGQALLYVGKNVYPTSDELDQLYQLLKKRDEEKDARSKN